MRCCRPAVVYSSAGDDLRVLEPQVRHRPRVVAAAAGVQVRALAIDRLLIPLGMTDTTWDFEQVPSTQRAVGYRREGGE